MIGVSPAKLEFNLKKGEAASQKIFLQNLGANPTKVAISLTEPKHQKEVSINPTELILPSREIQETEITVNSKKNLSTEIEIVELAKTRDELGITSGVKLPLEIAVAGGLNWTAWVVPILLAALATSIIFYLKRTKLKQTT